MKEAPVITIIVYHRLMLHFSEKSIWLFFSNEHVSEQHMGVFLFSKYTHEKIFRYSLIKNKILTSLLLFSPSLAKFVCQTFVTNVDFPRIQNFFLEIYPTQITI